MQRRLMMTTAAVAAALALAGCSTNTGSSATPAEKQAAINKGADQTMTTLYASVAGSRELVAKARGVLVFPSVYEAAFGIGGEYTAEVLQAGENGNYRVRFHPVRGESLTLAAPPPLDNPPWIEYRATIQRYFG